MGTVPDLESIYREHGARLWRSLLLATGDPEVASDAMAEAFAQAMRRGAELRDPLAWVRRVAFRIAAGQMKERGRMVELEGEPLMDETDSFIDLWRALARLTPHQRSAVVLADYAGYSHREIAATLGSSVAAVGVHVHRARRRLRELLDGVYD